MKWLQSALDFAVDVTCTVVLAVGAVIDDLRNER